MRDMLLVLLLTLCCLGSATASDAGLWIEGEAPSGGIVKPWELQVPTHGEYLSGGHWLQLMVGAADVEKTVPADGLSISWDFTAASAGHYQVWERYGFESIRSAWQWRIDAQDWRDVKPAGAQPFTDLMDPGFWAELAWSHLGDADLTAGPHHLQLKISREFDKDKKLKGAIHVVDCFYLSTTPFIPNGKHKPGESWQSPADSDAAKQVFTMPGPARATPDQRVHLDLSGSWQITRFDEWDPSERTEVPKALPKPEECFWTAIQVPGDKYHVRPDLDLCHRFVYRTQVTVPAELAGRAFVIHFPSINMIASVFVNGTLCGSTKAMLADWDCDVTAGIKPGASNQICVVMKDTYYAFSPEKGGRPWCTFAICPPDWVTRNWFTPNMDFPVASHPETGILEAPVLSACGAVYASDIFAQPSVQRKELALDVTVNNPTAQPQQATLSVEIIPLAGGAAVKSFAPVALALAANEEKVQHLVEPWADPKLWWPEDPQLYQAVAHVTVAGSVSDLSTITFGFREWTWNSSQFTLNGIPWHFHADTTAVAGGPEANLAMLHAHSQNIIRLWGPLWDRSAHEVLDICDRSGMVVRYTGIFDGEGANYMGGLNDPKLFANWYTQLRAWVKSDRNHPSILIWSIENEITFINSRNLGMSGTVEPMVALGGKAVMETDPTRPAMVDGGRCLVKEDMPVNGCHYDEAAWREYPDEAYTYALADVSDKINYNGWGKSIWRLVPNRPIFHGETYYLTGSRPADLSQLGGEEAFIGWSGAKRGAGLLAKMMSEGNRWHETAAFHFWLGEDSVEPYYNSWKPVCVLCREWNSTFGGGETVTRTLKVFNDTHYTTPIDMAWTVTVGGVKIAGGAKTDSVAPGHNQDESISFQLPAVTKRTAGELILTCSRGGAEVFRDVKPIAVIDSDGIGKTAVTGMIAVFDPSGVVTAHLQKRGIHFTAITDPNDIPAHAHLVIVGPDALTPVTATGTQWLAVAARGDRVIVLDQKNPLQSAAIPSDMTPSTWVGRVAFSENLEHPAFASLAQSDFLTWSGDHVCYRNPYTKPTRGAISLADCDTDLNFTCLAECRVNDGVMMLSQLLVGSKLASDPVASRLFDNLITYCESYQPLRKGTSLVLEEASPRGQVLLGSGLVYDKVTDPIAAISGKDQIAVIDGSPANLALLVAHAAEVQAYAAKGGWLFLWGVSPDGLADFNRLVGVDHLMRPFRRERVTLPAVRDPELTGITMSDVVMDTGQQVSAWSGQRFASSDAYTYVVDYDDVAPFCTYPPWQYFNPGQPQPSPDHDPYNLVNGFTTADGWWFIFQIAAKAPNLEWDITLPRQEELRQLDIIPNSLYKTLTRIEWTVDDDAAHMIPIITEPKNTLQLIALPPVTATKIHVKLAAWDNKPTADVIGIDNWWIHVKRSPEFYAKVKPLLNVGALVKYPQGKGGIMLCELNIPLHEENPENGPKRKNLIASLLRNLGAVYSGGKIIVAGANLTYDPVPFNELCNQFLTKDSGWFSDEANDLSQLPVGANTYSGVTYLIRDFKTSPLPCAISLNGPGEKTPLPPAVTGIVVGKTADALFFLHTWKQTAAWTAPATGDRTPPAAWTYVVHYSDGKSVIVPVRVDDGVSHWLQKDPHGLPNAVVAWAAPCGTGTQAVVYQMQWTNPRPQVAISTIDVAYDATVGNHYGVPVVLAISAAHQ